MTVSPEKIAPTEDITTRLDNLAQSLAGEYPPHTLMDLAEAASLITTLRSLTAERPVFEGVAKSKLESVTSRGWNVCGYAIEKDGEYGLVTTGAFVGWWSAADANSRASLDRALAAEAQLARQGEALKHYANPENWSDGRWPPGDGTDDIIKAAIPLYMQHEEGGDVPVADCGHVARSALGDQNG